MQKNWYIIYTKPGMEKKVATVLRKRKIESFVPVSSKKLSVFKRTKIQHQSLFDCYVFTRLTENETATVRSIDGIINFVYWKGKPARIPDDEVELIKEFTAGHEEIMVEKIRVNEMDHAKVIDGSDYSLSGNLLTVKSNIARVYLPSIGFSLVAKIENHNRLHMEAPFGERGLLFQS